MSSTSSDTVFVFGSNLAGYKDEDIAPMFVFAPKNCIIPIQWKPYMQSPWFYRYHDEGKLIEDV